MSTKPRNQLRSSSANAEPIDDSPPEGGFETIADLVAELVSATELAGLSRRVVRLLPMGNVKG